MHLLADNVVHLYMYLKRGEFAHGPELTHPLEGSEVGEGVGEVGERVVGERVGLNVGALDPEPDPPDPLGLQ